MTVDRRNHPCLSCPLPDCDDESPKCPLRRILSMESSFRRRGEAVPEELRRKRTIAYQEIYGLARNERRRQLAAGATA